MHNNRSYRVFKLGLLINFSEDSLGCDCACSYNHTLSLAQLLCLMLHPRSDRTLVGHSAYEVAVFWTSMRFPWSRYGYLGPWQSSRSG